MFWLFLFLVIVVIVVYRGKDTFKDTATSIKNIVSKQETDKTPEGKEEPQTSTPSKLSKPEETPKIAETPQKKVKPDQTKNQPEKEKQKDQTEKTPDNVQPSAPEKPASPQQKTPTSQKSTATVQTKTLTTTIYMVKVNHQTGEAKLSPVTRKIIYKDSPITRTINTLLQGPTETEEKSGVTSFIPPGTKLISAKIQNGHLELNFSKHLENNYSGRKAILLELSQLMLTCFEFKQVKGLSILIEGNKKSYLTGEGIPLKEVYTREDLASLY